MGFTELLLLGAIALIFIGPKQLPEIARVIARMINELKRATGDLGSTILDVRRDTDQIFRDTQNTIRKTLTEKAPEKQSEPVAEINANGNPVEKGEHGQS